MLSPSYAPTQQIVVLQNGEIVTGQVTQSATNTVVETEQGSKLVLGDVLVDFVCNSIDDAYWGKCARVKASDIAGQKSLFYWCLKHKLHQHAQNQILLLIESDEAKVSDIEFLDRQLNVAIEQLQKQSQLAAQQVVNKASAAEQAPGLEKPRSIGVSPWQPFIENSIGNGELVGNQSGYTFRPLPSLIQPGPGHPSSTAAPAMIAKAPGRSSAFDPANQPSAAIGKVGQQQTIQQVGFEEEIDQQFQTISLEHRLANPKFPDAVQDVAAVKPSSISSQPESVSNAQLDRMTRSMPEGTLGPYRSKLERVLINGCSAAKCHDSNAQVMPLMKLGRSKPIPRRMSQRNLYQTLKFIDRANPLASPLLAAASQPHAEAEKPILPFGTRHHELLKLWIIMLSDDPEANHQAYLMNPELQNQLPAQPIEESLTSSASSQGIVPVEPERMGFQPLAPVFKHSQTIGEIPELNKHAGSYQPVDPFDPEIFNRRFGNQ